MGKFEKKMNCQGRGVMMVAVCGVVLAVLVALLAGLLQPEEPRPTEPPAPTMPALEENPYKAEDFFYLGDYMACFSASTVLGVDVSEYQQEIDWAQVKSAGMDFAMVRLGYRGYGSGELHTDGRCIENLQQAAEAGLRVGAYFFSQAVTEQEAREEAEYVLRILDGRSLEYPVVYDWEYINSEARTAQVSAETVTACARAFCETIAQAGYRPMIYFNPDHARHRMHLEQLTDFDFWLAQYNDTLTFPYAVDMWQYTYQGTVPGITTPVDVNLAFVDALFPG